MILKTLRWVPCQLKLFIQLSWFVRSRKSKSEGCHHFDFKYLNGLTFLSIVWKLSKRGVLFETNQTGRWLCNVVARKRKAFVQESCASFAYYSGEKTFPYPLFIHPAPIRRYNYIKVSHIPLIRNTIFTISTHCVEERLSRWPEPASPPPAPSASSAARIRTLLWLLQDRFWKFHTNPRHVTIVCPQEIICQDPLVVFYHDILTQKEIKYMQSTELVTFLSWMLILI